MRFWLAFICCLLASGLHSQEPPQAAPEASAAQKPYVEREEREIKFYPGGKLDLTAGVPGSIRIIGWKKALIRLEAEKIVYRLPPEEAKAALQKRLRVRYTQTSSTIVTSGDPGKMMEINLVLYVPGDRLDVTAKLDLGDFSIEGVNGWVELTVFREGSIEAKSMSGYFSANTPKGDISVEMSGNRWKGLEFGAVTQRGSASLQLPVDYSAALQLETRDGKIEVDYPPQVVDGEEQPPDIVISKNSQSLKATVGDGGPPVKISTYSGNITLSKIQPRGQAPN